MVLHTAESRRVDQETLGPREIGQLLQWTFEQGKE